MYPPNFDYYAPTSLSDVIRFLDEHGGETKILAGGYSLIPMMKLRIIRPSYVMDINRVADLRYIKKEDDQFRIGALTSYDELQTSTLIRNNLPLISETASVVADPQVRNWGTLGGALVHSDPEGDMNSCILALKAKMVAMSAKGRRVIEAEDFFVDTFQSALDEKEILTEVIILLTEGRSGSAYLKFERRAGDFATIGVAVQLGFDDSGKCSYAGIALTAAGLVNVRATKAESTLIGNKLDGHLIDRSAQLAADESKPFNDPVRGDADYKRAMVRVYTKRAITLAFERASGKK